MLFISHITTIYDGVIRFLDRTGEKISSVSLNNCHHIHSTASLGVFSEFLFFSTSSHSPLKERERVVLSSTSSYVSAIEEESRRSSSLLR